VRIRFYVDGQILDEDWLDMAAPGARARHTEIYRRHMQLAGLAEATGSVWYAEAYDESRPPAEAYLRAGPGARPARP
jgi:hypothetical protein